MVNVMHPCWIYRGLDLGAVRGLDAAIAPLPFNFQIGQDIKKIPVYRDAPRRGALEVHADSCSGPLLAKVVLPKTHGTRTLQVRWQPEAGVHDLCLNVVRRTVDPVWAIEWVQPLLKE